MSAHWFSTLAFSIPGYFLDISICLELSYVSIFKHAFFFYLDSVFLVGRSPLSQAARFLRFSF